MKHRVGERQTSLSVLYQEMNAPSTVMYLLPTPSNHTTPNSKKRGRKRKIESQGLLHKPLRPEHSPLWGLKVSAHCVACLVSFRVGEGRSLLRNVGTGRVRALPSGSLAFRGAGHTYPGR